LYDYRAALTADLLSDPIALGATLVARTSHTSKRFQQFAENAELLGHVAATVLSEGGGAAALLESTLHRIVDDISSEREARTWLRAAKRSADRVRLSGASSDRDGSGGRGTESTSVTDRASAPVGFTLHPTDSGWQLRLRVPDYSPLFVRHPGVGDAVRKSRIIVTGSDSAPRPREWLTHVGTEMVLDQWPGAGVPMFSLERADASINAMLRDESRAPDTAPWIFRLGPDQTGVLVRTGAVHPGGDYVLLAPAIAASTANWVRAESSALQGANALRLHVPENPSVSDLVELHTLGCATLTDVVVEPVGIVPSIWDGDGYGEWLAGDEPLLAISTSHPVSSCSVNLDGRETKIAQLTSGRQAFIHLTDLKPGTHRVRLAFLVDEGTAPVSDAYIVMRIREPQPSNAAGTFRDPLQIRSSPATPTLEELWESRCRLEVDGPPGARASIAFHLSTDGAVTASHRVGGVALPLDAGAFREFFERHFRNRAELQQAYDESTSGAVEVVEAELGVAALELQRAFTPLRWGYRRVHGHLGLFLHDAADTGSLPMAHRFPFNRPDSGELVVAERGGHFHHPDGGLFYARVDGYEVGAVLAPSVHDPRDMRRVAARPRLLQRQRNARDLLQLLEMSQRWALARTPGDPLAGWAYGRVRDAIVGRLCGVIGGQLWTSIEERRDRGERLRTDELESALAKPGDHQTFRRQVRAIAEQASHGDVVQRFGSALGEPVVRAGSPRLVVSGSHRLTPSSPGTRFAVGGKWLAEFALRLASDPGSLLAWSQYEVGGRIEELLATPIVLRAARMIVLAARDEREWTWD
jgi:hypothetical protein